jgi:rubrerythrin
MKYFIVVVVISLSACPQPADPEVPTFRYVAKATRKAATATASEHLQQQHAEALDELHERVRENQAMELVECPECGAIVEEHVEYVTVPAEGADGDNGNPGK